MVLPHIEPSEESEAKADNGSKSAPAGESNVPLTMTGPMPYAPTASLRNPFPPIADYAFLSDCENTCLISSAGSVEWLCV
ncbi:glycosyl hydrolase family 15, partial [Mycolicibacterium elephantis]